ncbi:hypothetical protein FOZ60_016863 [Perkinsus olseni]|uniref:Sulfite exporter TauE/SafE n=1 Tax=Perkinsus olseni TaxID=32597 RepID=A0A7J6P4L3_PEROL|nr:hypothetical protein FOZ60_016863 [Perkinsus olseni]
MAAQAQTPGKFAHYHPAYTIMYDLTEDGYLSVAFEVPYKEPVFYFSGMRLSGGPGTYTIDFLSPDRGVEALYDGIRDHFPAADIKPGDLATLTSDDDGVFTVFQGRKIQFENWSPFPNPGLFDKKTSKVLSTFSPNTILLQAFASTGELYPLTRSRYFLSPGVYSYTEDVAPFATLTKRGTTGDFTSDKLALCRQRCPGSPLLERVSFDWLFAPTKDAMYVPFGDTPLRIKRSASSGFAVRAGHIRLLYVGANCSQKHLPGEYMQLGIHSATGLIESSRSAVNDDLSTAEPRNYDDVQRLNFSPFLMSSLPSLVVLVTLPLAVTGQATGQLTPAGADVPYGGPLDAILVALIFSIISTLCISAGVGGGGVFVPLLNSGILGLATPLEAHQSAALSVTLVTFAAVNIRSGLVDYSSCLLIVPAANAGTMIGVLISKSCPDWFILLLTVFVLAWVAYSAFGRFIKTRKKEQLNELNRPLVGDLDLCKTSVDSDSNSWATAAVLIISWVMVWLITLVLGGHRTPSILGLKICSSSYWAVLALAIAVLMTISMIQSSRLSVPSSVVPTPEPPHQPRRRPSVLTYSFLSFSGGIICSVIGIGGGHLVSDSTLLYGLFSFLGALLGTLYITKAVEKHGRQSTLVLLLLVVVVISAIFAAIVGVQKMLNDQQLQGCRFIVRTQQDNVKNPYAI